MRGSGWTAPGSFLKAASTTANRGRKRSTRELSEEIGITAEDFTILDHRGPYRYLFAGGRQKRGFHGNEQHYFLAEFTGSPLRINLATKKPEFQAHRWIVPRDFRLYWLPEMKREVYRTVLKEFFNLTF